MPALAAETVVVDVEKEQRLVPAQCLCKHEAVVDATTTESVASNVQVADSLVVADHVLQRKKEHEKEKRKHPPTNIKRRE